MPPGEVVQLDRRGPVLEEVEGRLEEARGGGAFGRGAEFHQVGLAACDIGMLSCG